MNATESDSIVSSRVDAEFLRPRRTRANYLERVTLVRAMREVARSICRGRILDVGCGMKPYQSILAQPGDRYIGLDYPSTMAGSYDAATRADVYAVGDALPVANDSMDTVISTQVLEHVPEPGRVIQEASRVLRPGGVLVLAAPMVWPLHEEPYDFYRYTPHGLRHLVEANGMSVAASISRGTTRVVIGQLLLEAMSERFPVARIGWKQLGQVVALVVNGLCGGGAKVRADGRSKLCLGWVVVARKGSGDGQSGLA